MRNAAVFPSWEGHGWRVGSERRPARPARYLRCPRPLQASRSTRRRAHAPRASPPAHLQSRAQQLCRPLAGGVAHDLAEKRKAVPSVPPQREPLVRRVEDSEGVTGGHYEPMQPESRRAGHGRSATLALTGAAARAVARWLVSILPASTTSAAPGAAPPLHERAAGTSRGGRPARAPGPPPHSHSRHGFLPDARRIVSSRAAQATLIAYNGSVFPG